MQIRFLMLGMLSLAVGCHTMSRSTATSLPTTSSNPSSRLATAGQASRQSQQAATQQLLEQRRRVDAESVETQFADSSRRVRAQSSEFIDDARVELATHLEPHLAPPRWYGNNGTLETTRMAKGATSLPAVSVSTETSFREASALSLEQVPAASDVMSLDEFEEMALANNPSLTEALALVQAAQGRWIQAGLPPNFSLGYLGQQIFSGGNAEQRGLYLQQEIVRGRKLELSSAVAAQEIDKARQIYAAQEQRVLTDVRLAYYNVLVAQRRNETTLRLKDIAEESLKTAQALYLASEIRRFDVMQTEVEFQASTLELQNALTQHVAAWNQLLTVTGVTDIPMRPLAGDLQSPIIDIDIDQTMQDLVEKSPELAAALEEVERARWAVDRANAEPIGNVDFQAVVQYDNAERGANANFQVSVPLPWRNRNQGAIRAAQAGVLAAERAVDRVQLNLAQRLAMVYQQYAAARAQVEQYSRSEGILEVSQNMLDIVRTGYEAGELEYRDLMLAQRNHAQKNLAYIEALGAYWEAVTEIDGLLLKDSLNTSAGNGG